MTDAEILAFTHRLERTLPPGYGFVCMTDEATEEEGPALMVQETGPPFPPGKLIWIAKRLIGGRILKGALLIAPEQDPAELEARAYVVVAVLDGYARRHAAQFN